MDASPFIVTGGRRAAARAETLADATFQESLSFLKGQGLDADARVLDAGCGFGGIARRLVEAARLRHRLVAIDADPDVLGYAACHAALGGDRVGLALFDLESGDPEALVERFGPFDLVYARFVVSQLRAPARGLVTLAQLVAPGGRLVVEDVDVSGHWSHPPSPAFEQYVSWYAESASAGGTDPFLGTKLVQAFATLGLCEIHVDASVPTFREGPAKELACATLAAMKDHLVAQRVATAHDVDRTLVELREYTADPVTIVSLPRIVRVAGRRML